MPLASTTFAPFVTSTIVPVSDELAITCPRRVCTTKFGVGIVA
jgi:hypothetical protein